MATSPAQFPRKVRAAPEPLGWYLRLSYVDHRVIVDAVSPGSVGLYGVVFDPLHEKGNVQRRFADSTNEIRQQRVHAAYRNLRDLTGHLPHEEGGESVLWGAWLEVPVRLQSEGVLSEGLDRYGGQSSPTQRVPAFARGAATK